LSPMTLAKMVPVAIVPSAMAASSSRKRRQNGDRCRL
jgi:hypothetical protein